MNPHPRQANFSGNASTGDMVSFGRREPKDRAKVRLSSDVPKVLIGVCSCRKYAEKRQAVRDTWKSGSTSDLTTLFFVGEGEALPDEPDTVVVNAPDSYQYLPAKVIAFFSYALENHDFDWLFKCDDDTYVVPERLFGLLNPEWDLIGNDFIETRGSPSGGAGYALSRAMVLALVRNAKIAPTGDEDILIGKAAISLGARAVGSRLLGWDRSRLPRVDNQMVTAHWLNPDRMIAAHTILTAVPRRELVAVHRHWNDSIAFYENGIFVRRKTNCAGRWTESSTGFLSLKWFDWGEETAIGDGERYQGNTLLLNAPGATPYPDFLASSPIDAARAEAEKAIVAGVDLKRWFEFALVISLPDSDRQEEAIFQVRRICPDVRISEGVRPDPDAILWSQIRGMEAYQNIENFRKSYIPNALGCRLAGLKAIEAGIRLLEVEKSSAAGFLVFQDDLEIVNVRSFVDAFLSLPDDADSLWLDSKQVSKKGSVVEGTRLRRIHGARLCTGFWISRGYARALVDRLRLADCEWDIFMEREMPKAVYYSSLDSVCRQRHGLSQITGTKKW